jgi:hypothetical protein
LTCTWATSRPACAAEAVLASFSRNPPRGPRRRAVAPPLLPPPRGVATRTSPRRQTCTVPVEEAAHRSGPAMAPFFCLLALVLPLPPAQPFPGLALPAAPGLALPAAPGLALPAAPGLALPSAGSASAAVAGCRSPSAAVGAYVEKAML